jgi:hypothetical protein
MTRTFTTIRASTKSVKLLNIITAYDGAAQYLVLERILREEITRRGLQVPSELERENANR